MHDAIRDVLAGREERDFAMFDYDNEGRVTDREAYASYIPELIARLDGERKPGITQPELLLLDIEPDEPDAATVNALISKLSYPRHQVVLSKLLSRIRMPEGVDVGPLLELFKDQRNHHCDLVRALQQVRTPEAEETVLAQLRKGVHRSTEELAVFAETLAAIGTIRSVPVLVAVALDCDENLQKQYFQDTLTAILGGQGMPLSMQKRLMNPATWKMNWGGAPELFAGFVEFIAMCMVSGMLISASRLTTFKSRLTMVLRLPIILTYFSGSSGSSFTKGNKNSELKIFRNNLSF